MKRFVIVLAAMAAVSLPVAASACPLPPPPHPCQFTFAGGNPPCPHGQHR